MTDDTKRRLMEMCTTIEDIRGIIKELIPCTVERLRPWMRHHRTCAHGWIGTPGAACTCGLDDTLRTLRGE